MKTQKKIISALFCLYIIAIFILCFMKGDSIPDVQFTLFGIPTDKLVHFCMFAPFPILSFLVFYQKNATLTGEMLLLLFLTLTGAALAYGTEKLQGLTGYRAYEIADFFADMIGIGCGTAAVLIYLILRKI